MNNKQKLLTLAALVVFVISACTAKWETTLNSRGTITHNTVYAPIWSEPDVEKYNYQDVTCHLALGPLISTWVTIGVCYGALFLVFKKKAVT